MELKVERVRMEWSYEPKYYLEKKYETLFRGWPLVIDTGVVTFEIDAKAYLATPIPVEVDKHVKEIFEGFKLQSFEDYTLKKMTAKKVLPDGSLTAFEGLRGTITIKGGMTIRHADVVRYDDDGNVIEDTAAERFQEKIDVAALLTQTKVIDPLVPQLLESWTGAIRNPDNEFVYLWEIWEALKNLHQFDKAEVDRFREIINGPYYQSRHRGEEWHSLKAPTKAELHEVRQIAKKFILTHLRSNA